MLVKDAISYSRTIKSIIDSNSNINALVKFKLLGMAKQLEPITENFERVRNENIYKYGTINENGGASIIEPKRDSFDNDEDYNTAMDEYKNTVAKINEELKTILNSDVNVNINKFKYTEIIDAGLSADYLLDLYELIEEWLGGIE